MSQKQIPEPSGWQHTSEGLQLAVTLLLGLYAGYKFDQHKGTSPWGIIIGAALGLVAGLYNFLKRFLKK